ncbi:GHKL domain-containing protein [Rathayibacter sp. VKM Ac-2835]|uniref:GHKL domain-containing protein n=1 Tax=Rathayibacter sp. VKM Ac-2835 TaxID=2739043 RepID=UPI001566A9BC|nr:GHKL domain-containing protein [Rathayibacter sp. VKM Ac-2835]
MIADPLPDIPRLLTAFAEWGACVVYVIVLSRSRSWSRIALGLPLWLAFLVAIQLLAGLLPIYLWTLGMAVATLVMFGMLRTMLTLRTVSALFLTARALVLAEFAASFQWQLLSFFFRDPSDSAHTSVVVVIYACILGLAGLAEARHLSRGSFSEVSARELGATALIAAATFAVSNISFVIPDTPFSGRLGLEVFYIRTLVDLCGFVALYAQQEQRVQLRTRIENAAMDSLLRKQHDLYLQSKRTMEEVDRKYHDMKNQIEVIRAENDPRRKDSYLDELEGSIQAFANQRRTGNAVLDILLSAKSTYCTEQRIQLTCVADGALLDFMNVIDITSVFGNALDNAIESSVRVPDLERRLIRVAVFSQNELLMIRVENTFDGRLRIVEGHPVSLKPDPSQHGFGLRNIRGVAEKYDGTVTFESRENWFSLRILIPLPSGAKAT